MYVSHNKSFYGKEPSSGCACASVPTFHFQLLAITLGIGLISKFQAYITISCFFFFLSLSF